MYVFAIALWACWTVISAKEWKLGCPVTVCPFPEKYASNLPHETECTKFYKCNWGKPVLQKCPLSGIPGFANQRLHYNRRLQVCDWPWQAGCASCPKKDKNDKCTPNPRISNPDDCDNASYYECINDKPKLRKCGKNTRFSRTCQKCVRNPKGGICKKEIEDCKNGDRKPHDCDCKFYYDCVNNRWVKRSCKGDFNPEKKICEEADRAGCKFLLDCPRTIENKY